MSACVFVPLGSRHTSNRADRGRSQDPSEHVPIACEKPDNATIFLSRCDRCPMIDTTSGGNGGSQFGDRSSDNPVENGDDDEFVQHARWAAVIQRDNDGGTSWAPGTAEHDAHAGEGQEAEAVRGSALVFRMRDEDLQSWTYFRSTSCTWPEAFTSSFSPAVAGGEEFSEL
jgi:hypothetical protein